MNIRAIAKQDDHEAATSETAYWYALALVRLLEPDPAHNTSRMIGGKRCHTLDEAVRALQECDKRN